MLGAESRGLSEEERRSQKINHLREVTKAFGGSEYVGTMSRGWPTERHMFAANPHMNGKKLLKKEVHVPRMGKGG